MFLQGRKVKAFLESFNRECVFRPLSIRNCLPSKMWDLQVCLEDLTSRQSRQCVSLCLLRLENTFLHHTGAVHEESGCRNVSGRAGCLTVDTQMRWHSLEMGQRLRVASHLLASEIPKCGVKLSLSEVRIQQLDGFSTSCQAIPFQGQLKENFKFCHQGLVSGFTLSMRPRQNPRVLHSDLGFLDLCNRENVMVVGLPFSVNVRAFPKGTQSGQIAIEK